MKNKGDVKTFSVNDIIDLMVDDCEIEVYSLSEEENVYNGYTSYLFNENILEAQVQSIEASCNKIIINIE